MTNVDYNLFNKDLPGRVQRSQSAMARLDIIMIAESVFKFRFKLHVFSL